MTDRYSIDADPDGIRALVADAIHGALAFGFLGVKPPPEGHWLTMFWQMGRDALAAQPAAEPVAWAKPVRDLLGHIADVLPDEAFERIDTRTWNAVSSLIGVAAQPARAGGDALTDERAEFEEKARAKGFPAARTQPGDACYNDSGSEAAWWGWQARAALAAAPQPAAAEPDGGVVEAVARAIYEQWASHPQYRPWVPRGNSLKQDEARDIARAAVASVLPVEQPAASTVPATSAEQESLKAWTIHRTDLGDWMLKHPYWGAGLFNTEDQSVRVSVAAAFLSDYANAHGIGSSKEGGSSSTGGGEHG